MFLSSQLSEAVEQLDSRSVCKWSLHYVLWVNVIHSTKCRITLQSNRTTTFTLVNECSNLSRNFQQNRRDSQFKIVSIKWKLTQVFSMLSDLGIPMTKFKCETNLCCNRRWPGGYFHSFRPFSVKNEGNCREGCDEQLSSPFFWTPVI